MKCVVPSRLQGPDLSKWFDGQGQTLRDNPMRPPVLGLPPPTRALLIAIAHLQSILEPRPRPWTLSPLPPNRSRRSDFRVFHPTFPLCARERGKAGAGAGKGTAIALPSSGEGGERLHLRVAGVGRAVGTKEDRNPKGRAQRLGVPGQGPAPSTRRERERPPRSQ